MRYPALVRQNSASVWRICCVGWALASVTACSDGATIVSEPEPTSSADMNAANPDDTATPAESSTPDGTSTTDEASTTGRTPTGSGGSPSNGTPPDEPGSELPSQTEVDAPVTPEARFVAPRGPCGIEARVGAFSIEKQVNFGVVQGSVADGVVPTAIPRRALQDGTCSLLERRTLACIPPCVGAETCGEDGTCIPYPRQVSVGAVAITGLTQATALSPLVPGNTYFSPGADNPPYAVGSQIVLAAAGDGEREAFQLFGVGSEPLALAPTWVLERGADLAVTWPAPTSGVETRVLVELTIDQHGASPLSLACEFPDTGSAAVPAAIVDRMIDAGVSGFPNGRITRRTADHVDLSLGCVELVVGSPLAASVSVSGFTPCISSIECPLGQQCNLLLQICE